MHERLRMVENQIAGRGIRDPALLNAMRLIPREMFVEKGFEMLPITTARCRSAGGRRSLSPIWSR
ncbi:hypothetical protein [Rhizobium leucaenae]|uniref:hypothetical protein n=1 Tax=Rhizobium leucaenae TaxID=29450 RepID=UPI0018242249|nr:hypothetical protein [Rhizobium leucaenae]MBB6304274.1 protein-L-isoaspartate O-methyltransferase [Rhizobium leucaenae]